MRQLHTRSAAILLAVALIAAGGAPAQEARAPVAGTWKLSVLVQGQDIALAIVKVEVKDGKAEASVVATGARTFSEAKVTAVQAGERSLHLTFKTPTSTFHVAAYGKKDERRPRVLTGSLEIRNNYEVATLEKTTDNELDQANPATPTEGADLLKKLSSKDDKERARALKDILEKHPGKAVAFAAVQRVWQQYGQGDTDLKTARGAAEDYVRVAAGFGREMEIYAAIQAARTLAKRNDGGTQEALAIARRAEKLLTEADPSARQLGTLKALAAALFKSDKSADALALKTVKERIAKLDEALDAEFEKNAVPFKTEPFAVRKDKGKRVAVVELFTGAHCPPCVAADVAFDALLKTYQPSEVVLLQYHLHVPRPDPLTNADAELRSAYYRVEATPTTIVNGKEGPEIGGPAQAAQEGYKELTTQINKSLEGEAKASLDLAVKRDGDKIVATAALTGLASKNAVRMHVLLIEDVVRYPGGNGQRLHHHVVRAVLGDMEVKLAKGDPVPHSFTVSVSDLRKKLADYLDNSNKDDPFLDDERPLDLKRLKVVALIQEKESKEILHAVQVDVPEGK